MHESIQSRLEEYLERTANEDFRDVERHLADCGECREVVEAMQSQSVLLRALRADAVPEPNAGFYARVIQQIESQARPSLWSVFLEPQFGRRLLYAAMTLFFILGTYLVSTEPGEEVVTASVPEQVLLVDTDPGLGELVSDPERDRDAVLVQLASYND